MASRCCGLYAGVFSCSGRASRRPQGGANRCVWPVQAPAGPGRRAAEDRRLRWDQYPAETRVRGPPRDSCGKVIPARGRLRGERRPQRRPRPPALRRRCLLAPLHPACLAECTGVGLGFDGLARPRPGSISRGGVAGFTPGGGCPARRLHSPTIPTRSTFAPPAATPLSKRIFSGSPSDVPDSARAPRRRAARPAW